MLVHQGGAEWQQRRRRRLAAPGRRSSPRLALRLALLLLAMDTGRSGDRTFVAVGSSSDGSAGGPPECGRSKSWQRSPHRQVISAQRSERGGPVDAAGVLRSAALPTKMRQHICIPMGATVGP